MPPALRPFLAQQRPRLWDPTADSPWQRSTRDRPLALMRPYPGGRCPTAQDIQALATWLQPQAAPPAPTAADRKAWASRHRRTLGLAFPAERALQRMVRTAFSGFCHALYHPSTACRPDPVRAALDARLVVGSDETHAGLDRRKAAPAAPGSTPLQHAIAPLHTQRALHVPPAALAAGPGPVLHLLTRRAAKERGGARRAHPAALREALLACCMPQRTMDGSDPVVRLMLERLRRLDPPTDQPLHKARGRDSKRVAGKGQGWLRVAEAGVAEPAGTLREVWLPRVQEETLRALVTEAQASGAPSRLWDHAGMRQTSGPHERQRRPRVLEPLPFRSAHRLPPVREARAVLPPSLGTQGPSVPEAEPGPLDGVVRPSGRDTVRAEPEGKVRINRQSDERCVLPRLARALTWQEVGVEGAEAWRHPRQDLPTDGQEDPQRAASYRLLGQPVTVTSCLEPRREQRTQTLGPCHRDLPQTPHGPLAQPAAHDARRRCAGERWTAHPAPSSLAQFTQRIRQRDGRLALFEVCVDAERLGGFTPSCTPSGTKAVRARAAWRPLLLLELCAEGTTTGSNRVATAHQHYPYDARR